MVMIVMMKVMMVMVKMVMMMIVMTVMMVITVRRAIIYSALTMHQDCAKSFR